MPTFPEAYTAATRSIIFDVCGHMSSHRVGAVRLRPATQSRHLSRHFVPGNEWALMPQSAPGPCHTRRLGAADHSLAKITLNVMAEAFETDAVDDRDVHLADLLRSPYFWLFAATIEGRVVGGLTGYILPMARTATRELFVYDLAVDATFQRRGVATSLMSAARQAAQVEGVVDVFLVAEYVSAPAVAFYRAIGMSEVATTLCAFESPD